MLIYGSRLAFYSAMVAAGLLLESMPAHPASEMLLRALLGYLPMSAFAAGLSFFPNWLADGGAPALPPLWDERVPRALCAAGALMTGVYSPIGWMVLAEAGVWLCLLGWDLMLGRQENLSWKARARRLRTE